MEDYDLRERFSGHLLPREYVIWCGRPRKGKIFTPTDFILIPFSLVWGGFAVYWNVSVWRAGAPIFFNLFGLPFLVIAAYLVFGRFIHAALQNKKTYYAITDSRILVLTGRGLTSRSIQDIAGERVEMDRDGKGSIYFGDNLMTRYVGNLMPRAPGFPMALMFSNLEDCRDAYSKYQSAKNRLRNEAGNA